MRAQPIRVILPFDSPRDTKNGPPTGVIVAFDASAETAIVQRDDSGIFQRFPRDAIRAAPAAPPQAAAETGFTPAETAVLVKLAVAWAAAWPRIVPGAPPEFRENTIRHLFQPPLDDAALALFLVKAGLKAPEVPKDI